MRKFIIIAAAVLGGLVLCAGAIIAPVAIMGIPFAQNSGPRPSDAEMIAHWRDKRAVLERLAAMMREDNRIERIGKDWIDPNDPATVASVSAERLALYRKLLRDAGILLVKHYGKQVELVYFTSGIYIRGSAKSFCFGPPPNHADRIDGDLDQARDQLAREHRRGGFTLQRRIEDDWWLQYEGT